MFKIKNIFGKKKDQTVGSTSKAQYQEQVQKQQLSMDPDPSRNAYANANLSIDGSGSDTETDGIPSIQVKAPSTREDMYGPASLSSTTKVSSERSLSDGLRDKMSIGSNEQIEDARDIPNDSYYEEDYGDSQMDEDEIPDSRFPEQAELRGYVLINKIGEGAFSTVFRGIPDKSSSQSFLSRSFNEVAIKVIKKKEIPSFSSDQHNKGKIATKEQVLKEVKIHKLVSSGDLCQEVVQFIDFQESEHFYFIVQELLSGGEIFGEIVKYTYFSEDLARHVTKQLASAVKHLHSMGVVHRDIKPENLLFEPIPYKPSKKRNLRRSDDPNTKLDEGEFQPGVGGGGIGIVKLADFGLSKQIYETNTKTPCGTVGYTAPEVVKDERYSMKVDMWGIGCVLYTLLCGFPPFYDEKIDILTEKISRGEYSFLRPWWDEISPGAKNCVKKLLEVDPNKRYGVNDLLNDDWLNSCDVKLMNEQAALSQKRKSKNHYHHKRKVSLMNKDSSLLYSPAANAMRDAFDVSNAVQRIQGDKREFSVPKLFSLAEDEEDFQYDPTRTNINDKADNSNLEENMFQLRLNSSTIIKRRNGNPVGKNNSRIIPIPALLD